MLPLMKAAGIAMILLGVVLIALGAFTNVSAAMPVSLGVFLLVGGALLRSQKPRRIVYTPHVPEPDTSEPNEAPKPQIRTRQTNPGGAFLKILVGSAAVAMIVCAVVYLRDRNASRLQAEENARAEARMLIQIAEERSARQNAIRDGRAIVGMSRFEVEAAKGKAHHTFRGIQQPELMRQLNAVETWVYEGRNGKSSSILFDISGRVIFSGDTPDDESAIPAKRTPSGVN